MATCFGNPCDHHQANFYRLCAFNVRTILKSLPDDGRKGDQNM